MLSNRIAKHAARCAFPALLLSGAVAVLLMSGQDMPVKAGLTPALDMPAPQTRLNKALLLPGAAAGIRRHRLSIIAFGSSSTEGVGASSPAHSYPALLQKDLTEMLGAGNVVAVLNRGIGGQDADDMLARLDSDVIAAKPDLVIWQTGTNDPLRKVPLARFVNETREGIQRMRAAGIEVMLMEPQDCRLMRKTPEARAYLDAVRAIGAELSVPVIHRSDLIKAWLATGEVTEGQIMAADGLHMADGGYERLAAEVARELLTYANIPAAASLTAVR